MSTLLAKRLPELQADPPPRLVWSDILSVPANKTLPSADAAKLDAYLRIFTPWEFVSDSPICICCRKRMLGGLPNVLFGESFSDVTSLTWGLQNGECHCRVCLWPSRAYHRDVGGTGEAGIITFMHFSIQYHPLELKLNPPKEATA
jgi:hypothetical protein